MIMKMHCRASAVHPGRRHRLPSVFAARPLLAVVWAVVLLGLNIYVNSPLHQDDPSDTGPCPFCQFQNLVAEPAAAPIQIGMSVHVTWYPVLATLIAFSSSTPPIRRGRAPPPPVFAI